MEPGDRTGGVASDTEPLDPEPLAPQDIMDVSTDSAQGASFMEAEEDETQSSQSLENVKICSFCGCGRKSLLGQGELYRFDPSPGFNPFKRPLARSKKGSDLDDKGPDRGPKPLTSRRQRGAGKK